MKILDGLQRQRLTSEHYCQHAGAHDANAVELDCAALGADTSAMRVHLR